MILREDQKVIIDNIYLNTQRSHPKCPDVRKYWTHVLNPEDNLIYVLRNTGPMDKKLKVFADMQRKAKAVYKLASKEWGKDDKSVRILYEFLYDPSGISHYVEGDTLNNWGIQHVRGRLT